jgi:hypothetical protein
MDELHVWPGGARLREIADQIEREHAVADKKEHDAATWVRAHGGLDNVKAEWGSRVPYDKHEQRRQRLLGHIAECETALGRRNQRIKELGRRVGDLTRENAELRKRTMPEGCEWPRYEDEAPVRIGHDGVRVVELFEDEYRLWGEGEPVSEEPIATGLYGQRVRRPAVLAADGEPLEVGQTVWSINDGREYKVVIVDQPVQFDTTSIKVDDGRAADGVWVRPDNLTHRAPVLAADGRPLREGEHVWHIETGTELVVKELPKPGAYQAVVVFAPPASHLTSFDPDQLTHERPDSWERLEKDVTLSVERYRELYEIKKSDGMTWPQLVRKDLVRRAKALAKRGR